MGFIDIFTSFLSPAIVFDMKNPKTILITGGSSGIGQALAEHYAQNGVFLALSGRNGERLAEIADICRNKGAEVTTRQIDVTDKDAMYEWITELYKSRPLDLIIANAGISGGTGGVMNGEPLSQARAIFDTNITGVLNTIDPALQMMHDTGNTGQIAIVSSLAGYRGWPTAPAYSASKGAVRFYGEALRGSLRNTGIEVNVICPGFVKSRMTDANDFHMPMIMSAQKAAQIIAKGLEKNKGRISFPFLPHCIAWFVGILPDALAQKILAKAPAKPALIDSGLHQ